jgi:hypothetical protein
VVIRSAKGSVLHGQETLEMIKSLGAALECVVIEKVPVADWNDSDWPEVLEAARRVFMEQGRFEVHR